jgi:outer membrane protein
VSQVPAICPPRRGLRFLVGIALPLWCGSPGHAEQKPLWEAGLGAGALAFADYRGADSSHAYPVPVPYLVYRGAFLKVDRDGVRGLFFNSERAELTVSVNVTTPVSSHDTDARDGMPGLKPAVEVGPELDLHLWRSADRQMRLDLALPLRHAFTIEANPRAVGWFAAPCLDLEVRDIGGHAGWDVDSQLGPLYADHNYHEYFYSVAPQYATATRPAYQARGGYSGAEFMTAATRRYPNHWVFMFVRYDALNGASFVSSPLVRSRGYWLSGVGIAWMIGKSSHRVEAED